MPQKSDQQPGLMPLLLCGVAAYLVYSMVGGRTPQPTPVDPVEQSEWCKANQDDLVLQLRHVKDTIAKLDAGEIDTDEKARQYLEAGRKAARQTAWKPVAEKDEAAIGGGNWTAAKHAARLRDMIGEPHASGQ